MILCQRMTLKSSMLRNLATRNLVLSSACAVPHCLSMFTLAACRIPTALPEGADGPVQIKVISGKSYGVESPVRPLGGCWYFHITFTSKGSIFQDIRKF